MHFGAWNINKHITIAICTKYPATYDYGGNAVDADALPTYKIYEEDSDTVMASGTFVKIDDSGTIGLYRIKFQLSAVNGFEVDKSYTCYITYAISGIDVTEIVTFNTIASVAEALAAYDPPTAGELAQTQEDLTDILLNKEVITRHANGKPSQYTAGTSTNQETVNTTIDINGNIETELRA